MSPPVSPRWDVIPGPIYTREDATSAILASRFPPDSEVSAACLEQLKHDAPGTVIVKLTVPFAHRLVLEDGTIHRPMRLYGRACVDVINVSAPVAFLDMALAVGAQLAREAQAASPVVLGGGPMAIRFIGQPLQPLSIAGPSVWVEGGTGEAYAVYVTRYFLTPALSGEVSA